MSDIAHYPSPIIMIRNMYANSTGQLVSDISLDRLSVASGWSGHDLRRDIGATKLHSDREHTLTPLHGAHQ